MADLFFYNEVMSTDGNFFSVHLDLVVFDMDIPYDLYVNSSVLPGKEKFVKVYSMNNFFSKQDFDEIHRKYPGLFIAEEQRQLYVKSLMKNKNVSDISKTNVLKDSAVQYLHKIFDQSKEFSAQNLAESIEGCREVVENMVDLFDDYSVDDLRKLIGDLSFHDFYTFDHSINVSMYCISIYRAYKPEAKRADLVNVGLGGLLHDLGKIKIPTHILNNPGKLSTEEYDEIKKHPDFGLGLLLDGHVKVHDSIDLKAVSRIVHEHHENVDGTGYPNKLKAPEISEMAKVCSIADFFDAITTKRSYNQVLILADALNVMRKFRGVKLDASIFDVFEKNIHYVKSDYNKDLRMKDEFDPTLPYKELPLETVKSGPVEGQFGKIKIK